VWACAPKEIPIPFTGNEAPRLSNVKGKRQAQKELAKLMLEGGEYRFPIEDRWGSRHNPVEDQSGVVGQSQS
jgi:hypothetical protein